MRLSWRRKRAPVDASDRGALGRWGEELAAKELKRGGYKVLERNVRFGRGELDIVAAHRDTLVFVEVKTRQAGQFGSAREAISRAKAAQLSTLAMRYLRDRTRPQADWRIDVVAIDVGADGAYTVEIIEDALGG